MSYMYRSKPEILRFQPIPLSFFLYSLLRFLENPQIYLFNRVAKKEIKLKLLLQKGLKVPENSAKCPRTLAKNILKAEILLKLIFHHGRLLQFFPIQIYRYLNVSIVNALNINSILLLLYFQLNTRIPFFLVQQIWSLSGLISCQVSFLVCQVSLFSCQVSFFSLSGQFVRLVFQVSLSGQIVRLVCEVSL